MALEGVDERQQRGEVARHAGKHVVEQFIGERDAAGPGVLRLAGIIRQETASACVAEKANEEP